MKAIGIGAMIFTCVFGGVLVGMWLRTILPQTHLDTDSKDDVKVGIGLIATMTALLLGLITASAKSGIRQYSSVDPKKITKKSEPPIASRRGPISPLPALVHSSSW